MTTATIFIPDISGFTEFLTQTEIKHSSHIINELLEGIIASNTLDFYLSEVEGDAVLFYKKGEAVPTDALVGQCVEMYRNFHVQLKIIERDSICHCGACTTASGLTLKFIVHFGEIQEITIGNLLKATGADMIVAHRLLKTGIDNHEYVLLSASYLGGSPPSARTLASHPLQWHSGSDEYSSIGKVDYAFTSLQDFRQKLDVPAPPSVEVPPDPRPDALTISTDIHVPMAVAYQRLIDTDKRSTWVKGMTTLEREPAPERVGFTHFCLTDGLGLDHTAISASFEDTQVTYIEKVVLRRWGLTVWDYYKVESLGEHTSRLSLRFAFRKPGFITRIVERLVLRTVQKDFEAFKKMCEDEYAVG